VHGIGDVEAAEAQRRADRGWQARKPAQRCGVDGCEFQTKLKGNLQQHQARVHGIRDVDANALKKKRRVARPKGEDDDEVELLVSGDCR
jgi:hypothetical protein